MYCAWLRRWLAPEAAAAYRARPMFLFRKIGSVLRGKATPMQVMFATVLGGMLGFVPGFFLPGDLGGGYFPGIVPPLRLDGLGLLVFGALGVASAVVGGWVPARQAQALQPAQALKGLGTMVGSDSPALPALAMLAVGAALFRWE